MQTTPTTASVTDFVETMEAPARRADAESLIRLLGEITGQPPVMWGTSIVGFGQYHYRYASKHEGDWFVLGFAMRKQGLTLYVPGSTEQHKELLQRLGKHTTERDVCISSGCLILIRSCCTDCSRRR